MKKLLTGPHVANVLIILVLLGGCARTGLKASGPTGRPPAAPPLPENEPARLPSARAYYRGMVEPPPSTLPRQEEEHAPPSAPSPAPKHGPWHWHVIATHFDFTRHRKPRTAWNETDPIENPYYLALPFNDRLPGQDGYGPCANRWVEIVNVATGKRAFGQWKDVGPWFANDSEYVFDSTGTVRPFAETHRGQRLNIYRERRRRPHGRHPRKIRNGAGIDLSPALADTLGIRGKGRVHWRFVDPRYVPGGPWNRSPSP